MAAESRSEAVDIRRNAQRTAFDPVLIHSNVVGAPAIEPEAASHREDVTRTGFSRLTIRYRRRRRASAVSARRLASPVMPALDDVTPLKLHPDDSLLEGPPPAPVALAPPAPVAVAVAVVPLLEVPDVALDSPVLVAPPVVVVGSAPPEIETLAQ